MSGTCCVYVWVYIYIYLCMRATAACPCSCMRVLGTCVSTLSFLQFTFRRIRFYSIMQLACVFKYILEFGTLVETTRRATLSSSFFHSEFRSRSPIFAFPLFAKRRRLSSALAHTGGMTPHSSSYLHFTPISSDRDSSRSDSRSQCMEKRRDPPERETTSIPR